jgi:hypothetical protein
MSRDLILRGGRVLCAGSTMPEELDVGMLFGGRVAASTSCSVNLHPDSVTGRT